MNFKIYSLPCISSSWYHNKALSVPYTIFCNEHMIFLATVYMSMHQRLPSHIFLWIDAIKQENEVGIRKRVMARA